MRNERFLYSLCYFQKTPDARTKATVLARIPLGKLANASAQDWQYLCQAKGRRQGSWGADLSHVESLIPDGGPEMSLFYHKPLGCFVTVYQAPLSRDVNLRVARNVAGPWSASIVIYRAPEIKLADGKSSALVYAGKAHAHLSNGESIGFTYCANPGGLEQHAANPGIYFPNALSVRVPRSTVAELLAGAEKTVPER